MEKVKTAVIGLGQRGYSMIKYLLLGMDNCEIVAVCDKRESRIRDAKKLLGDVLAFTDFDEFIKQDMDAVYIANYFCEHVPFVIKAFERNIHVICECISNGTMAEGVELILKGLPDVFAKMKITVFGKVGEQFDPNIHNAVMHIEDEEAGSNMIVEEFMKGYKFKDKVIRYSMVKVANAAVIDGENLPKN